MQWFLFGRASPVHHANSKAEPDSDLHTTSVVGLNLGWAEANGRAALMSASSERRWLTEALSTIDSLRIISLCPQLSPTGDGIGLVEPVPGE